MMENKLSLMLWYNISAEELFLIELLFLASIEENHPEYLIKYLSFKTNNYLFYMLASLKSKKIIENELNEIKIKYSFNPKSIVFNKDFLFKYRRYSYQFGQELLNSYPAIIFLNNTPYNAHNISRKFNSIEEFDFYYGKSIQWNENKHKEVIELLKWAKETHCNLINVNIADFLISRIWNQIKILKENNY